MKVLDFNERLKDSMLIGNVEICDSRFEILTKYDLMSTVASLVEQKL